MNIKPNPQAIQILFAALLVIALCLLFKQKAGIQELKQVVKSFNSDAGPDQLQRRMRSLSSDIEDVSTEIENVTSHIENLESEIEDLALQVDGIDFKLGYAGRGN